MPEYISRILLWPEQPNTEALRNLRVALSRLRDAIGDRDVDKPFLEVTRRTIQFNFGARCSLDVRVMEEVLKSIKTHEHAQIDTCAVCAKQLQIATALYRGEFLTGFSFDSTTFEAWTVVERENLHWQALEALYTLASYHEKQENYDAVIDCARRQIDLELWREGAHRQLMRALASSGHRAAALAQFDACRKILSDELGVEPETETLMLYEHIRDGSLAPPQKDLRELPATALSLEMTTTPYAIQKTDERPLQPQISQILDGERRIVTVVQTEMRGTTSLLASINTENWATMISQLLRAARVEIRRFGGDVYRYAESGLTSVFGAQITNEDDPERAVLAALAMQKAFRSELVKFKGETAIGYNNPATLDLGGIYHRSTAHPNFKKGCCHQVRK